MKKDNVHSSLIISIKKTPNFGATGFCAKAPRRRTKRSATDCSFDRTERAGLSREEASSPPHQQSINMASTEQVGQNKTWELSLYEMHRTPQEAITDNTEIAVSPRSLHSELMCPICLDMLKKTMTTKECLHRFCSDCIITALRSGNKVC